MSTINETIEQFVKLTGQALPDPVQKSKEHFGNYVPFSKGGLGYSQFNELLLTLGYDRVQKDFFSWVFENDAEITDFTKLKQGVEKFRRTAMLLYGHIKYAFKRLSQMNNTAIEKELHSIHPLKVEHYTSRHKQIHNLEQIPSDKAYYLGYMSEKRLKDAQEENPSPEIDEQIAEMRQYRESGRKNHYAYLVSDHLDVYIATSMRERHEFEQVNMFVKELFQHNSVKDLKLRYFDPTQAYCEDRIDKGLVEGLMIKRARCTIYHVQESDTLGKDSELAATLAQGKPVIAYIPEVPELSAYKQKTLKQLEQLKQADPTLTDQECLLKQLQRYYPEGAWNNAEIKRWITDIKKMDAEKALEFLHERVNSLYNRRANNLKNVHPLGLQVNLSTGVANGVLVVRNIQDCGQLLRSILLNEMKFLIEENDNGFTFLKEVISGCIYRVSSGDDFLINAFWNFYLKT